MQTLIYKTDLLVECALTWLAPNDPIELQVATDHTVVAYARPPLRWGGLFRFGRTRLVRIGIFDDDAVSLLRPATEACSPLRVRVVAITPARLTADKRAQISVSVWADTRVVAQLATNRHISKTPRVTL